MEIGPFGAHAADAARQHDAHARLLAAALRARLLLHLTNPKAILVWLSIVSLAVPATGGASHTAPVVLGCMVIGVLVFSSYAVLFSTATARRVYGSIRRWLDGSLAVVFSVAGIKLLTSRG